MNIIAMIRTKTNTCAASTEGLGLHKFSKLVLHYPALCSDGEDGAWAGEMAALRAIGHWIRDFFICSCGHWHGSNPLCSKCLELNDEARTW